MFYIIVILILLFLSTFFLCNKKNRIEIKSDTFEKIHPASFF